MTFSAIARELILCDLHTQEDRDETRAAQGESCTDEGMSGRLRVVVRIAGWSFPCRVRQLLKKEWRGRRDSNCLDPAPETEPTNDFQKLPLPLSLHVSRLFP
jgi:hypothetical protein